MSDINALSYNYYLVGSVVMVVVWLYTGWCPFRKAGIEGGQGNLTSADPDPLLI